MTGQLADEQAREAIRHDLESTMFVEAGAGSGKTKSLIDRVLGIVMTDGVRLHDVAAVTFTEKAASELRDRLRVAFEEDKLAAMRSADEQRSCRAEVALDDLDSAAIGTLHSFARRLLGAYPIEAGLPPLIKVLDEVGSQVAFDERWSKLNAQMLADADIAPTLVLAMACGITLEHLRGLAKTFNAEWDRLDEAVLAAPPDVSPPIDVRPLIARARRLADRADTCLQEGDLFKGHLRNLGLWADRLAMAGDEAEQLTVLKEAPTLKFANGVTANWPSPCLNDLRCELKEVRDQAQSVVAAAIEAILRRLAYKVAEATIVGARDRQARGRLEFHDLLVLARELLSSPGHGAEVRGRLHDRYQRLLLDEFQDTDPIQVELAVRIAGGAAAAEADWRSVQVPAGRLFIVGDPKQSIYRFRRADIGTYLTAQETIGGARALTTNFRTTRPLLDWVNRVFGRLIIASHGSQPAYQALDPHRDAAPGGSHVLALGVEPHGCPVKADEVRHREAADVVATIRTALADRWQVLKRADSPTQERWCDVELGDIAILVPARTSLPFLESALDQAGIPYRAEASSLVYRTTEVRDLLLAAQAVDDPSDAMALVNTLRSPLFGCGDDDLWTWKRDHGSWNLLAPAPAEVPDDHPVRAGMAYLRGLHDERSWLAPSEVLDKLVRDRRMLEVAGDGPRARDVWRRLRFVIDQARAWTEAERGGLRAYLAWARRQADESARVAEAVLPESDTAAVRIMTVHAAKGLEFPVVIVSGMSSMPGGHQQTVDVIWPTDGRPQYKFGAAGRTIDFDNAKPLDEQMGHHERLRLLYVACTRARDHLVVSMHRTDRTLPGEQQRTSAELLAGASEGAAHARLDPSDVAVYPPVAGIPVPAPRPYDDWLAGITLAQESSRRPSAISASSLEKLPWSLVGGGVAAVAPDAGLAKGPRDLELPPWNKGRYGTAIGKAVHGVLQTVNLATWAGLQEAAAAQVLAEGVVPYAAVVTQLCRAALNSPIIRQASCRPNWRETYVGTTLDDGRILEGFVDLIFRDDSNGLVIVDYKTDAVPSAALNARVQAYTPQMAAYARALCDATGEPVGRAVLLFLSPAGALERTIEGSTLTDVNVGELVSTRSEGA